MTKNKKSQKKLGRPLKLSLKLQEEIVELIKAGNFIETACVIVGISKSTFYDWIKRGRQPGHNNKYNRFFAAVEKAKAWAEARDVAIIAMHAETHWQAAAWKLERKYSVKWGQKRKILATPSVIDSNHSGTDSIEFSIESVKVRKYNEISMPTKLTPELHERIVNLIKAGNYDETAIAVVGVSTNTFYEFMKKGKEPGRNKHTRFFTAVEKAKAWSEARDVSIITKNTEKDWRVAAWKLERKHPKRWSRQRKEFKPPGKLDSNVSSTEHIELLRECAKEVLEERAKLKNEGELKP